MAPYIAFLKECGRVHQRAAHKRRHGLLQVSRLIGAPPGYVGFEDGGQLTEAVRWVHALCLHPQHSLTLAGNCKMRAARAVDMSLPKSMPYMMCTFPLGCFSPPFPVA